MEEKKRTFETLVVDELPKQNITSYVDDKENKEYELLTVNEAIKEILDTVRKLEKKI